MKIIGVEIQKGTYEGNAYHNVKFYGTYQIREDKGVGLAVAFEKMKHDRLCEQLAIKAVDAKVIQERFMGRELEFAYDKWKNATYVTEVKEG
jgi:hypothetical protein